MPLFSSFFFGLGSSLAQSDEGVRGGGGDDDDDDEVGDNEMETRPREEGDN
jgi:hypothetical protein